MLTSNRQIVKQPAILAANGALHGNGANWRRRRAPLESPKFSLNIFHRKSGPPWRKWHQTQSAQALRPVTFVVVCVAFARDKDAAALPGQ